jgi:hypothetical protein
MSKPESEAPYALFEGNAGGFLTVEFPKSRIALPYIALRQITHDQEPERIVMEFTEQNIEVHGRGLKELFESLALLRVKTLRVGAEKNSNGSEKKDGCKIEELVALEG